MKKCLAFIYWETISSGYDEYTCKHKLSMDLLMELLPYFFYLFFAVSKFKKAYGTINILPSSDLEIQAIIFKGTACLTI